MFIALLIPSPKNPKGNLDIYMQLLIEEFMEFKLLNFLELL